MINVARYIRPSKFSKYDSTTIGATLYFVLDYSARRIHVGISICNGDCFNKKTGIDIAKSGKNSILNIKMPEKIYDKSFDEGLVQWFIMHAINEGCFDSLTEINVDKSTILNLLNIYIESDYNCPELI